MCGYCDREQLSPVQSANVHYQADFYLADGTKVRVIGHDDNWQTAMIVRESSEGYRLTSHYAAKYSETIPWAGLLLEAPADGEAKLRKAVNGYSAAQVDKALKLIADGKIKHADFPAVGGGVYVAISSDGVTRYLADGFGNCNCPAGGKCYHGAAAKLLDAGNLVTLH